MWETRDTYKSMNEFPKQCLGNLGFAIKNDLLRLKNNRIIIKAGKKIIDVQLLFKIYMYVQREQSE